MQSREEEISAEELIETQRRLLASKNPFERVIGTLCVAGLLKRRLAALSDAAVGQLMFDYVWNDMHVFSPELTICEAATERLLHSSPVLVKSAKERLTR